MMIDTDSQHAPRSPLDQIESRYGFAHEGATQVRIDRAIRPGLLVRLQRSNIAALATIHNGTPIHCSSNFSRNHPNNGTPCKGISREGRKKRARSSGQNQAMHTPSASGRGQVIARCPKCKIAVWSHYAGSGPLIKFVRVGTLDDPNLLPPDIRIFTESGQPWLVLPEGTPAVAQYYEREHYWPSESLARRKKILPRIAAYLADNKSSA